MNLQKVLEELVDNEHISDLHLTVNSRPIVRETGRLEYYSGDVGKLSQDEIRKIARSIMDEDQWAKFQKEGELDFSYSLPGVSRFRVNVYQQRGSVTLAMRIIPQGVPSIDDLGLPRVLKKLALQRRGLILCTGPTGSGKSTSLAAMIQEINKKRKSHIITLEDPIEYLHNHQQSIVHQREVGTDTTAFSKALRATLRQDPDVILVGEMRDLDTMSIALEAAETGHLVMSTLHTNSASQTVDRIVDAFPAGQQEQIRIQLASVIKGVIAQQLLPKKDDDGRVAAFEIMVGTSAVKNIIREGKSSQLESAIQTGGKHGMIMMENYLLDLYNQGEISRETAIDRAQNTDYLRKRINR